MISTFAIENPLEIVFSLATWLKDAERFLITSFINLLCTLYIPLLQTLALKWYFTQLSNE